MISPTSERFFSASLSIFKNSFLRACLVAWLLVPSANVAIAEAKLLDTATLPGNGSDLSELTDVLATGVPHNRLGGISAIEYSGEGTTYLLLPDRGPADGATRYHCRYHRVELSADPMKTPAVAVQLKETTLLNRDDDQPLTGFVSAFDKTHPEKGARFDPEGLRLSAKGTLFISDEYGPFVAEFQEQGKRLRNFKILTKYDGIFMETSPDFHRAQKYFSTFEFFPFLKPAGC